MFYILYFILHASELPYSKSSTPIPMLITTITADPSIQSREALNPSKITEFVEILEGGGDLTPITVYCDGVIHWLSDGFHRHESYLRAGRIDIPAKVHQGTFRDAVLCAIRSNAHHGIGLSLDERRNAVWRLLSDPEWHDWSSRKIGLICGLDHEGVERIKKKHLLQNVSGGVRQIQSVTNPVDLEPDIENPDILQNVSGGLRQIQSVTNQAEPTSDIRRYTKNGKDHVMDVSKNKSRGRLQKSASTPPSNVIDITHLTQTVFEALSPSIAKSPCTFRIHKAHCEEPLISDYHSEITIKFLTSGPSFAMPTIVQQMEASEAFAQFVLDQALQLAQQSGTAQAKSIA